MREKEWINQVYTHYFKFIDGNEGMTHNPMFQEISQQDLLNGPLHKFFMDMYLSYKNLIFFFPEKNPSSSPLALSRFFPFELDRPPFVSTYQLGLEARKSSSTWWTKSRGKNSWEDLYIKYGGYKSLGWLFHPTYWGEKNLHL